MLHLYNYVYIFFSSALLILINPCEKNPLVHVQNDKVDIQNNSFTYFDQTWMIFGRNCNQNNFKRTILTCCRATKEYEDSQTVQDIRKKFEKKIPPSTAPKPTGRPQARGRC